MRTQVTDEEKQEAYDEMRSDLRSGECAIITSPASGSDEVYYCGKLLGIISEDKFDRRAKRFSASPEGVFRSREHALRAIEQEAARHQFWPSVYHVNERGAVDLLNSRTGKFIESWV